MEIDISEKVNRAAKYIVAGVVLLAILCSAGVWWWQRNSTHIILRNASVSGDLVNISVKAPGTLLEFLVNDGDTVVRGDQVAKLQIRISPEQINRLETAAADAKAQYQEILSKPQEPAPLITGGAGLGAAEVELDRAAKNKERMDNLFAIGGVSQVQQRQAEAAYQAALGVYQTARSAGQAVSGGDPANHAQMVKIAELQMKQADAALEAGKKTLQANEIAAPVSGVVHFVEVKAGDSVEAGQTVLKIGDVNNLWIEVTLEPKQASQIRLGQFVEYSIADYPGKSFKGTIYEIGETAHPEGGEGKSELAGIPAKISLPTNFDIEIKPGMRAEIKVSL